uniref:Uncharacterized protein n=1 Tax=Rattus norvegicus TaxID=10116 RepID=A0A8I6GKG7_RAT
MEQAIPATEEFESKFHVSVMPSLPVMLFLILLLLPSMLMEEVLMQTQKKPTISSDHKTNKGDLDMIVSQGEPNIHEDFEMMIISAFDQ